MNTSLDCSSDRFIPLRGSSIESMKFSHKHPSPVSITCRDYCREFIKNDSGTNFMQHFYKKNQYKDVLANTLFQSPRRVFYFSPKQKSRKEDHSSTIDMDWPVKSRRKPLITKPEFLLDMPDVVSSSLTGSRQRVDWGSSGYIAAIHGNCCIHTYNPDTSSRYRIQLQGNLENCLKWNDVGDRLVLSLKHKTIGIWDVNKNKMLLEKVIPGRSRISYIAYTQRFLITVHYNGMIQLWDHDLFPVNSVCHAHKGTILSVKVSCYENFLATNGIDSSVKIWSIPMLRNICQIYCEPYPIVAMDWHPWKDSLLAVGKSTSNSFCTLWNVNQPSDIRTFGHPDRVEIDCLSFNPISAELVVSFWLDRHVENEKTAQNIVIQSNLTTVVDDINFHSTRVQSLMWNKNGKRLATVGADENLAIWNFFGKVKKKNITPVKKEKSIFNESIIR